MTVLEMPMACAEDGRATDCFHCGEPVTASGRWTVEIDGVRRGMCCAGCQAVAETIVAQGLDAYYRERTRPAPLPAPELRAPLGVFDLPGVADVTSLPVTDDGADSSIVLMVRHLSCPACAWLLERGLQRIPGVTQAVVNFGNRDLAVRWNARRIPLSALLAAIRKLGFDAVPLAPGTRVTLQKLDGRRELKRLGLAALLGMQVMMIAAGLYFEGQGDLEGFRRPLGVLCGLFTLPVATYCAWPFHRGAWYALRAGGLTMDVPVSAATLLAYGGSVMNLVLNRPEIYFDSVAMFISLLLASRWLEQHAMRRSAAYLDRLAVIEPEWIERIAVAGRPISSSAPSRVLATALEVGDVIRVGPGNTLPCDGRVVTGCSTVDEQLLTGESTPLARKPGDEVIAGSVNLESVLDIEVGALGEHTVLARIGALARGALLRRENEAPVAQRAVGIFIVLVLILASCVACFHALRGADWIAPTLVVLVISCPCALALAAPTAMSAALAAMLRRGVLVLEPDALARFARIDRIVFDKTGTLTDGRLSVRETVTFIPNFSREVALATAAGLERGSTHPVGRALIAAGGASGESVPMFDDPLHVPGYGVSAWSGATRWLIGSRVWLARYGVECPTATGIRDTLPGAATEIWMARGASVVALVLLDDEIRAESAAVTRYFREAGLSPLILSGDHALVVAGVGNALGMSEARGGLDPKAKLAALEIMKRGGKGVAAVGDGINDTPLLAAADVGITLEGATSLARQHAAIVLLRRGLAVLPEVHQMARRLATITRQNLIWGLAYNLLALPLAVAGVFQPWVAALLMAGSSLVVVVNAARLYE